MDKKAKAKTLILLHLTLMLYSLSGIFSKKAAYAGFLSRDFIIYYGIVILLLGVYAISWQQIIKKLPLTTAFSNKAVTIVWGIIWGAVFYRESVSPGKVAGAAIVIIGIVLYVHADRSENE